MNICAISFAVASHVANIGVHYHFLNMMVRSQCNLGWWGPSPTAAPDYARGPRARQKVTRQNVFAKGWDHFQQVRGQKVTRKNVSAGSQDPFHQVGGKK